jgi:hydroxypyruvate isomerase
VKFGANISWLFRELPFLDRIAAARRAGFAGIEFHAPEGQTAAEIAAAARDAEMCVVLFNAWPGDLMTGGLGLSGVPGREQAFRHEIARACEFGEALGGGACVQIGQSRVPQGVDRGVCLQMYVENLRHAAKELSRVGCRALVEPLNVIDAPGILIHDVQTAVAAIDAAADERIGLLFDCYHESMAGRDPGESFTAHAARVAHVQFSDAPGRHEPGSGAIDFVSFWKRLAKLQYRHWVDAEYRPQRSSGESLTWFAMARTLTEHQGAT